MLFVGAPGNSFKEEGKSSESPRTQRDCWRNSYSSHLSQTPQVFGQLRLIKRKSTITPNRLVLYKCKLLSYLVSQITDIIVLNSKHIFLLGLKFLKTKPKTQHKLLTSDPCLLSKPSCFHTLAPSHPLYYSA